MQKLNFKLSCSNDIETGSLLAVYLQIRRGKAAEVREIGDGTAFVNYDSKGRLLGVEILAPCRITVLLDAIAKDEPDPSKNRITRFLKESVPRKMALR